MPSDLTDPEGFQPFYRDPLFFPLQRDTVVDSVDGVIKAIALEELGHRLSQEKLKDLKAELQTRGFLSRNPGDPSFKKEVIFLLNKIKMAQRIACVIRLDKTVNKT